MGVALNSRYTAVAFFLLGVPISFLVNFFTADGSSATEWYKQHTRLSVVVFAVLVGISVIVQLVASVEKAHQENQSISLGQWVGGLLSEAAKFSLIGVVIGLLVDWKLFEFLNYLLNISHSKQWQIAGLLQGLSREDLSCILAGVMAGQLLRLVTVDENGWLSLAGCFIGLLCAPPACHAIYSVLSQWDLSSTIVSNTVMVSACYAAGWGVVIKLLTPIGTDILRQSKKESESAVNIDKVRAQAAAAGLRLVSRYAFELFVTWPNREQWFYGAPSAANSADPDDESIRMMKQAVKGFFDALFRNSPPWALLDSEYREVFRSDTLVGMRAFLEETSPRRLAPIPAMTSPDGSK